MGKKVEGYGFGRFEGEVEGLTVIKMRNNNMELTEKLPVTVVVTGSFSC